MRREYGDDPAAASRELAVLRDLAPASQFDVRMIGNRAAQFVETRPDGSKAIGTPTYVDDQLRRIDWINPTRTITYTWSGGVMTRWAAS